MIHGLRLLYLAIFFSPYLSLQIASTAVTMADLLLLAAVILLRPSPRFLHHRDRQIWLTFVLAGVLIVLGTVGSAVVNEQASILDTAALALQYGLTLVALPLVIVAQPPAVRTSLMRAYVYGLCSSVVVGLAVVELAPSITDSLKELGILVGRGREGLFTGVSRLSKMAAMAIAMTVGLARTREIGAILTVTCLAIAAMAIIVARSASGVVAGGVVALLLVPLLATGGGHADRAARSARIAIAVLMIATVGWAWLSVDEGGGYVEQVRDRVFEPVASGGLEEVGSFEHRRALNREAIGFISTNPVLGIGPGVYIERTDLGNNAHNVFLLMWAETGVVPVAAFSVMLVLLARVRQGNTTTTTARMTNLAVLAGFVVGCLTSTYFYPRGFVAPVLITAFWNSALWDLHSPSDSSPNVYRSPVT